jgi:hypothetical protein
VPDVRTRQLRSPAPPCPPRCLNPRKVRENPATRRDGRDDRGQEALSLARC